jgi:hypothetical protein
MPPPSILKIKLKVLGHKGRLAHKAAQQFAFCRDAPRRDALIEHTNRHKIRVVFSHTSEQ